MSIAVECEQDKYQELHNAIAVCWDNHRYPIRVYADPPRIAMRC